MEKIKYKFLKMQNSRLIEESLKQQITFFSNVEIFVENQTHTFRDVLKCKRNWRVSKKSFSTFIFEHSFARCLVVMIYMFALQITSCPF